MPTTPRGLHARERTWPWAVALVLALLASSWFLLVQDPRYFFRGDTQAAYYGWWYQLGHFVRGGDWRMLDVHAWRAGNLVAEGQWGLFSPLTMGIGALATVSPWVVGYASLVKMTFACVGGLGVFALVRSYGVPPPVAFLAGVAAPMGGMTQYLDLPSWAAALMIWALVPWAWWAIRRTMLRAQNPLSALVACGLVVTVGYVYGTIMLIVVLAGCLLDCWVARDRAAALRVLGIGVVSGLVAVLVYLPGVLTAPVTMRPHYETGTGKFTSNPLETFLGVLPTVAVSDGRKVNPYNYLIWFLPALLWVDLRRLRQEWRPLAGLCFFVGATLIIVNGPSDLGPLRWPLRLQPFLTTGVAALTAVALTRLMPERLSLLRLALSLLWVLVASATVLDIAPRTTTAQLVGAAVVLAGLSLLWLAVRRGSAAAVGAVAGVVTLLSFTVQHLFFPNPPSSQRNMPSAAADYLRPADRARGDVIVLGDTDRVLRRHPAAAGELLAGSAWYLSSKRVQNTYTAVSHFAYHQRWCMVFHGATCPRALDTLFSREPETRTLRADLLAVSTVVLVRADYSRRVLESPPPGWRVAEFSRWSVTWVRRDPVPGAGRPVWSSPGTRVTTLAADDDEVRFRADEVAAGGGRVVLSALAWPGYRTDVGEVAAPVEDFLLTLDVPEEAAGRVVTVSYRPPGWTLELASGLLALALGGGWVLLAALRERVRRV